MNTKTKLLLTAVMASAALTFSPHTVMAVGMEDSQGMMMDDKGHGMTETAIHGFCPVCVINGMKMKGKDNFTTEYNGKVYKFVGIDQQKMFINDPEKYVADLDTKFNALKDEGMMKKDRGMMEEGSH
jgi:YHS domain-containing protein